jgi:hypothetical protein
VRPPSPPWATPTWSWSTCSATGCPTWSR